MKLYRTLKALKNAFPNGCALTIGNFDGVHLGHQAILQHLKKEAKKRELPAVVMLFEPQPNEFFSPHNAPARLMRLREKLNAFKNAQIDAVICVKFNAAFAQLSAENFIKAWLVDGLKVKFLSVGDDFHFGAKRQGNFQTLKKASQDFGFELVQHDSYLNETGERVSSTLIRETLKQGNFSEAKKLLNKPFTLMGKVIHGQKLGRTIGLPTANLTLKRYTCPIKGVFAVIVHLKNGKTHQGVANVGFRPTVNGERPLLEVHLLNFEGDLYGQTIEVSFCLKLRDEQKFESLEALKNQIHQDIQNAQHYFQTINL